MPRLARSFHLAANVLFLIVALAMAIFAYSTATGTSLPLGPSGNLFPKNILYGLTALSVVMLISSSISLIYLIYFLVVGCIAGYNQNIRAIAAFFFCLLAGMAGQIYTAAISFKLSSSATSADDAINLITQVGNQELVETELKCCDWEGDGIPRCDTQLPYCVDALQAYLQSQYLQIAVVLWGLLAFYLLAMVASSLLFVMLVKEKKLADKSPLQQIKH
jgi:hypothetical protein